MDATKTTEPKKHSRRQYANLDKRYGKIGIPAVAAALRHHDEPVQTPARENPRRDTNRDRRKDK
jgi:hypothetical protein